MQSSQHHQINAPNVIEQSVDDETLIVDLERGHYFSLRGSARAIWLGLASGATQEVLLTSLENRYQAPREQLAQALAHFVGELLEARLLIPAPPPTTPIEPAALGVRVAFDVPALTRYTDIEDMLTIDPIHDVDERGWPNVVKE